MNSAAWLAALDPSQREAVQSSSNTVVTAGAGSGKTSVLSYRYLYLIQQKIANVDSILTLTFTRKAAAEMYQRIYGLLQANAEDPWIQSQMERFDQGMISTIDSFCSYIVRSDALRFGIPPSFTTEDQGVKDILKRETLSFLDSDDSSTLLELVRQGGTTGFEDILDGLTQLAFSVFSFGNPINFSCLVEYQFQKLHEDRKEMLARFKDTVDSICKVNLEWVGGVGAEKARGVQWALEAMGKELSTNPQAFLEFASSLKLPLGNVKDPNLLTYKNLILELRGEDKQRLALLDSLLRTEEAKPTLEELYRWLAAYQSRVEQVKRSAGILTFRDVAELAVEILKRNTDLRQWLKKKFKAILVDEFQDNNQLQKDLLYLLAEKEDRCAEGIPPTVDLDPVKLFFVGDEKQSIYRFRGADVRVFKGLSDELKSVGGAEVHLVKNYRSHPDLIRFFNHLFDRIMHSEGSSNRYEARFEPTQASDTSTEMASSLEEPSAPRVHLFWKPIDEKGGEEDAEEGQEALAAISADEAEAYFLAQRIQAWVAEGTFFVRDKASKQERPAQYDDFALLLRSTGNQIHYERMFRLFHIPYTTVGTRSLFLEAPVNDLYVMLQTALYPEDRLAYAALLRSPFVGLDDEAVLDVLLQEALPFESPEGFESFSTKSREKFDRGRELYREVLGRIDQRPVPELLSYLWFEGGYRYWVLRNPIYHPYLELYEHLREFALLARGETLSSFLDRLRPNLGNYERLSELEIQRDLTEGVQLLTIHKAKGLQYPIVILANAGNTGRNSQANLPFYVSEKYGITIRLGEQKERFNYFYEEGKKENEEAEQAELKRLFYVGCTRAESHLIISGVVNTRNKNSATAFLPMLFQGLGSTLEEEAPCNSLPDELKSVIEVSLIPNVSAEKIAAPYEPPALSMQQIQGLYQTEVEPKRVQRSLFSITDLEGMQHDTAPEEQIPGVELPATEIEDLFLIHGAPLEGYFGSLCHSVVQDLTEKAKQGKGITPPLYLPRTEPLRAYCPYPELWTRLLEEAVQLGAKFLQTEFARQFILPHRIEIEVPFLLRADTASSGLALDFSAAEATAPTHAPLGAPANSTGPELPIAQAAAPATNQEVANGSAFKATTAAAAPKGRAPSLIRGRIDMVVVSDSEAEPTLVLDFKTDRYRNPTQHSFQMDMYRRAAEELWGKPVVAYLLYLRSGEAARMDSS